MKELILGGARSGKSALAERLAGSYGAAVTYLATATPDDDEMRRRIARHRQRRPEQWRTIEEPLLLADALRRHASETGCVIVDCLTLWLSNLLHADRDGLFERERKALLDAVETLPGRLLLVGNEVGLGIVPMGELTRRFQDESGRLHQALAARCDRVILTVAGLPHLLKGEPL